MSCNDIRNCRTLSSMLSSCASTVFLCTWATLHLDVPEDPDEPWKKRLLKRIGWTIVAFLAPEVILFMALEDWTDSCGDLVVISERYPNYGWTETHALFARMGGFRLVEPDGSKQPLRKAGFIEAVEKGQIDVPKISLKEIQEKSKRNNFAKIIAIFQTVWFLLQTMNRVVNGYQLTQLELSTSAYVLLYLLISWCWWNKPVDVRFPIDVRSKTHGNRGDSTTTTGEDDELADKGTDDELQRKRQRLPIRVRMGAYFAKTGNWTLLKSLFMSILYLTAGGLFGAIHCLAWTWPCSSNSLWQISAVYVTVFPDASLVLAWFLRVNKSGFFITVILSLVYIAARVSLLVLTFLALHSLTPGIFFTPSWTIHIPHIG